MIETTHAHTYCRFLQKKLIRVSRIKLNQKCKIDSDTKKIKTLARGSKNKYKFKKKILILYCTNLENYFVNTVLFIYPLA